jgi:hypothetical protein
MVFIASLSSLTTAEAAKNTVTSPSTVAAMPLEDLARSFHHRLNRFGSFVSHEALDPRH